MQYRIKGSRADVIPVTGEFLDHLQAKHGTFTGMVKDMQSNQARVKRLICIFAKLLALVAQEIAQPLVTIYRRAELPDG